MKEETPNERRINKVIKMCGKEEEKNTIVNM